jgi:hypothetical protein
MKEHLKSRRAYKEETEKQGKKEQKNGEGIERWNTYDSKEVGKKNNDKTHEGCSDNNIYEALCTCLHVLGQEDIIWMGFIVRLSVRSRASV